MRPKIYYATDHDIDPVQIDNEALYVVQKLVEAGYKAYLVGGSVRDLLTHRKPKDFDVSTTAKPEEIKAVFRRKCILIGRRFRLAHIRFGNKIIEVATFRSGDNESDLIIRDNQWGSEEEDVLRRDFTINGLYFNPLTREIIDYVDGWEDIHKNTLRSIGDPLIRFKQDPVRMIRLLKFRARFGFHVDEQTKQALLKCKEHIAHSSPARVLEELLRMLESGYAAPFFYLLHKSGILKIVFPTLDHFLTTAQSDYVFKLLKGVDLLKNIAPPRSVCMSCLLFPMLELQLEKIEHPTLGDVILEISSLIRDVVSSTFSHFPRRMAAQVSYILSTQYKLTPISKKRNMRKKMLTNREFVDALQFLKVRALANRELQDDYDSWKNFHHKNTQIHKRKKHPPPKPKA
ncbi:MAG: polynucleotide adenylyltransferase PcnB [Waddliaceae bacterium]